MGSSPTEAIRGMQATPFEQRQLVTRVGGAGGSGGGSGGSGGGDAAAGRQSKAVTDGLLLAATDDKRAGGGGGTRVADPDVFRAIAGSQSNNLSGGAPSSSSPSTAVAHYTETVDVYSYVCGDAFQLNRPIDPSMDGWMDGWMDGLQMRPSNCCIHRTPPSTTDDGSLRNKPAASAA